MIIPAVFYQGDLGELRYLNIEWWRDELKAYYANKPNILLNNELTVFDVD